jgi:hypothetical protein
MVTTIPLGAIGICEHLGLGLPAVSDQVIVIAGGCWLIRWSPLNYTTG